MTNTQVTQEVQLKDNRNVKHTHAARSGAEVIHVMQLLAMTMTQSITVGAILMSYRHAQIMHSGPPPNDHSNNTLRSTRCGW